MPENVVVTWDFPSDEGVISSPFNMEMILLACPALLAAWKKRPFVLLLDKDGRVVLEDVEKILCQS